MTSKPLTDSDQHKQKIAGIFSRSAPTYDQVGPSFFVYFGRRLVELAQIPRVAKVLDVATGRGALLFQAAEAAGVDGRVIGIDIAEGMLHETSREIKRRGLLNAEALRMDAENLQFPDESFDCVLCGFGIFFFPDPERTLAEFRRVLKPHGRLALTSWDNSLENEEWRWLNDLVDEFLPPNEEKKEPTDLPTAVKPDLFSQAGIEAWLKTNDFEVIHLSAETRDIVYDSEDEWWNSQWSHGGRAVLEEIEEKHGSHGLEQYKSAVYKALAGIRQTDGIHDISRAIYAVAVKS